MHALSGAGPMTISEYLRVDQGSKASFFGIGGLTIRDLVPGEASGIGCWHILEKVLAKKRINAFIP